MDIRNLLFSGQGFLGSTGQKIFGRGYSPIRKSGVKVSGLSDTPSVELTSLQQSNERQEALLKVVAKNTFNMNMMARDMNITRQNIASLTKSVTGKSSKGADALWMGAAKRDAALSSAKATPQTTTTPQKVTSSSSFLGGIVGGLAGLGGGIGSVIFRALGSVIAIAPLLGIIGIAASAYAIKKMSDDIDFGGIYDSVKKGIAGVLGIDLESEKPILRQLAENLNNLFNTKKFTDIYDWIDQKFGDDFKKIRDGIETGTKLTMAYTEAAFKVLSFNFGKLGEIFSFHFKEFINQYKPELLLTLGAAIGGSVGSLFGIKGAALGALVGSAVGYITGKLTQTRTPEDIEKDVGEMETIVNPRRKRLDELRAKGRENLSVRELAEMTKYEKELPQYEDRLSFYREELSVQNARLEGLRIKSANFAIPGNQNYNAIIEESLRKRGLTTAPTSQATPSTSPTRVNYTEQSIMDLIYKKFRAAGYSDSQARAAIANAIRESGLNPYAENTNGEDSYGLFQINLKAHNSKGIRFTKEELMDPEKNIDAKLKIMATDYREQDKVFRDIFNPDQATDFFMRNFSRPKDQSINESKIRISNLQKIPGNMVDRMSTDLAATTRGFNTQPATPAIPVPPSPPNQQAVAPKPPTPQVANPDTIELFFNLAFAGTTR
jgi:hypothetical protein